MVIEIINHLWFVVDQTRESDQTAAGSDTEIGMEFGRGPFRRFAIEPDDQKLARVNHCVGGKRPLSQARIIVAQKIRAELQPIGCRVVQFQPRIEVAQVIGDGAEIVRLNFIQPQRREGRQRRQHIVRRPRRGWVEDGLGWLNAVRADNPAAGESNRQPAAVRAGQIPVTERVLLADDQRCGVLPDRTGLRRAGAEGNQMQAGVAGMLHGRVDDSARKVRRNIPRRRQGRLEITVLDQIRAGPRDVARNQHQVVQVNIPRRGQIKIQTRTGGGPRHRDEFPGWRRNVVRVHSGPVADAIVVLPGINQLQRRAGAVRQRGPGRVAVVADPGDDDLLVRRGTGLDQTQRFAPVVELAIERAGNRNRAAVNGGEDHGVLHNRQKSAG